MMTNQDEVAAQWVARNRGKLSEIANQVRPRVSSQFVHLVLRGKRKSSDGRVERLLRREGAPLK